MFSGCVTVSCGRSTKANGGALGSQDRKDGMLHLQFPKSWLPCWLWHPPGNHLQTDTIPTTNFPYYFWGRGLRRLEGAGIELSSVQLVHKFAATLSNTMIHKQFKNDKKGFGQFGPLAEGRGVSSLRMQNKVPKLFPWAPETHYLIYWGAAFLISEACQGPLTAYWMRQFCPKMLCLPGHWLGISEALWPQGLPH